MGCQSGASGRLMASGPNKGQGKGTFGRDAGGAFGQESSTHRPPPHLPCSLGPSCGLEGFQKLVESLAAFSALQHLE